ncbi:MAG: OmpA family protein [Saprospiraceae bacterium]|nr:OmpA family protein [Saprospiraceae bacterium]
MKGIINKRVGLIMVILWPTLLLAQARRDTFFPVHTVTVLFDHDASDFPDSSVLQLQHVLDSMARFKHKRFELYAHTSMSGSREYNQRLSEKRLERIKNYLISKGIDPSSVVGRALGKTRPLDIKDADLAETLNRRVEVKIYKRFALTSLQGKIKLDEGELDQPVWIKGDNKYFADSVLSKKDGSFTMMVPDLLPITLTTFVRGYAVDLTTIMVNAQKERPMASLQMLPLKKGSSISFHSVQFHGNKNVFLPKSMEGLENMGIQLIRNPDYCYEIQGHVNAPGVPASQVMTYMDLSKSRAGRVYQWLIDKGMKADRMIPVGYGHLQMLFPNSRDEASQEKNRRVEVYVLDCAEVAKMRKNFSEEEFIRLANLPLYNDLNVPSEIRQ